MSQPDIRLDVPSGTAASTTLLLDVYQRPPSARHAEGYMADALPGLLAFLAGALGFRAPSASA